MRSSRKSVLLPIAAVAVVAALIAASAEPQFVHAQAISTRTVTEAEASQLRLAALGFIEKGQWGSAGASVEQLFRPVGCTRCDNKGYKGRRSVMELLVMDGDLDELVARRATAKELRAAALAKQFRPLAEEGVELIVNGTTSLAEVSRSVDLTGRFS